MRLALALFAPLTIALVACGSETSGTIEGEDGESGEYTIDNATGETTATIKTDEGVATLRSGSDVPVNLPAGFSVYPGAEVVTNTVVSPGEGKGEGNLVSMSMSDSPDKVVAYYKAQAEKAGVEIQMDIATKGGKMVGGQSPDGLTFSIIATPDNDRTMAQLAVGTDLE